MTEFKKGMRVKYSEAWLSQTRNNSDKEKRGVIPSHTKPNNPTVGVQWDGRNSKDYYHKSFIVEATNL